MLWWCDNKSDLTWSWLKAGSLTLYEGITSSIGLTVWLTCFCEVKHTTHTGCLSSRQKSLSFSLCKLQISSDPDERLSFLSFRNDSHKFFNTRLHGGLSLEDLLLQTGPPEFSWFSRTVEDTLYTNCDYMTEEQDSWRFHDIQDKTNHLQIEKPFSLFVLQRAKLYFHFLNNGLKNESPQESQRSTIYSETNFTKILL